MAATPVRESMTRLPPLPERVHVEPFSTDARQKIVRTEHGELRIWGLAAIADANGAGAELSLSFDDARVTVGLHEGQTPEKTALLLQRVLPAGYRLSIAAHRGDEITFELVRLPLEEHEAVIAKADPELSPQSATPHATPAAQPVITAR